MQPERVVDAHARTGEGPLWHDDESVLYWVDIPEGELYRFDPEAGENELVYDEPAAIGGYTIQDDGALLLFEDGGRVELFDDGDTTTVIDELPGEQDSRFNDVVADPKGRVFAGTMPTDTAGGTLYRLQTDGSIEAVREDLAVPNGMGFSPSRTAMYFVESEAQVVHTFDYDQDTGELTDAEPIVEGEGGALPDGLTVDAAGMVWIAFWNGNSVGRYTPDGTELARVEFPARKVSSIAFGGEDLGDAYVTTALGEEGGTRAEEGDGAGALFRFDPNVTGRTEFRSSIDV